MAAIATHEDVAARLARTLTEAQQQQATAVIASVTGLIGDTTGLTVDEVEALSPVPETLKALAVDKAVLLVDNPGGLAAFTETLGAHTYSGTYPRAADIGIFLSADERRRVRRAVGGTGFLSVGLETPYSGVDSDADELELPL